MKILLIASLFVIGLVERPNAQIKAIHNPDPVFPAEASDHIYGDVVRVEVEINKEGRVTKAIARGPLIPCNDRENKAIAAIQKAAVDTAKSVVFEPVLDQGKPKSVSALLTYPLRPNKNSADTEFVNIDNLNKRHTNLPAPYFPTAAKARRVSGSVQLAILVDEIGKVLSFSVLSGHPLLAPGTFDSACKATFEPATINGKPAKAIGTLTYHFKF